MSQTQPRKYLYIDFEYNQSQEKHPNLVCASWMEFNGECLSFIDNRWLLNANENKKMLADYLLDCNSKGYIMCSYAVTAEARCFEALGLDPMEFTWHDLHLEFKQLQNKNDKYLYGRYFDLGVEYKSEPDKFGYKKGLHTPIKSGLVWCVGHQLGIDLKPSIKDGMRALILECKPKYSKAEQAQILAYCDSDIHLLPELRTTMNKNLWKELGGHKLKGKAQALYLKQFYAAQRRRGEFAALTAMMETEGIPIDLEAMRNLRANVPRIKNTLIETVNEDVVFYVRKKKRKADLQGEWAFNYELYKKFVEEDPRTAHVRKNWPKSKKTDKYSLKDEHLKVYDNVPCIRTLRQTRKQLDQIKSFRAPNEGDDEIFDKIGKDNRLRCYFNIYGSQTSRSQPSTKTYIPLMSAWLKCLIKPPEGMAILDADYSSQEFAIAACLSGDKAMDDAYRSGDPYFWFAKAVKAVPQEGKREDHEDTRDLFKSTTLGLQFGMGKDKLAIKLSADTGKEVTVRESDGYVKMYKRTYSTYQKFLKAIDRTYAQNGRLVLPCGWALFADTKSVLSARNHPIQGRGGTMMRLAVKYMQQRGLTVIFTVHDSMAVLGYIKDIEKATVIMRSCMMKAYDMTMGTDHYPIRIGVDVHKHGEVWVSGKGKYFYDRLKKYLKPMETKEDRIKKLMETVFAGADI